MTPDAAFSDWIRATLRHEPRDIALFRRALTHGSQGGPTYQRLEFLGDRVLGLSVASWLYQQFPDDPEGKLSARLNAMVSREACAEVGRDLGVPDHLILGKQAREDGAQMSDNVVGDVVEALIGALYLESGLDGAAAFVRRAWDGKLDRRGEAPKHPKSALQEWAAARQCAPPVYKLIGQSGPHHAPVFKVEVTVGGRRGGAATAEGSSKQEAETAAATALLKELA
jgi:ribonuclease-3